MGFYLDCTYIREYFYTRLKLQPRAKVLSKQVLREIIGMIIIQSTVFFFQDLWRTSTISISYASQHSTMVSSTENL